MGLNFQSTSGNVQNIPGAKCDDIYKLPLLTADQNNLGPVANDRQTYLLNDLWLLASSLAINLSGIQGGIDGRRVTLLNAGAFNITLLNNSGLSLAANRFNFTVTLQPGQSATVQWSSVLGTWFAASSGGGSSLPSGTVSDAIAGTINDYAPTGFGATTGLLVLASTNAQLSGLLAGTDLQRITMYNSDFTHTLTLLTENGGSAAANRFKVGGPADLTIQPGGSIGLIYSTTVARWLVEA